MNIKYTKQYAEDFINENGFSIVSLNWDKGVKSFVTVKCKKCGNELTKTFYNFQRNHTCPKCRVDRRALKYEDVKRYVEIESNSNCKFLETEDSYLKKRIEQHQLALCKFEFQCECGNKFEESFNTFKSKKKQKCNECTIGREYKLSYKKVKEYIEKESNSGCKLISNTYENNSTPLKIQCSCGKYFYRTFADFKDQKAYKCHSCSDYKEHHSYEDIKNQLEIHNLILLTTEEEYINTDQKLKIKCSHNHISERLWNGIKRSDFSCPYCNKKGYNRNTESFKHEVETLTKGEYSLISEYKTMNDYVTMKHNTCGHTWKITPHNFLDDDNRCPECSKSKGEQLIKEELDKYKVFYSREYSFEDLYGDYAPLRFDFAIFNKIKKNNLKYLIEYDGEFHYFPILGQAKFDKQKKYDALKNEYCKINNIKLIRIPYWDKEKIPEIIKTFIEKGLDI